MERPYYILFAGVNGAGKSTLYRTGGWQHNGVTDRYPRVNTDEILAAQGLNWADPKAQFQAGREAVKLIKQYLSKRESLNQETTLTGKSIVRHIEEAHEAGFYIVMFYVSVEDVSIAQERIAHRESIGGHGISSDVVKRRYKASIENLVRVLDICNEAYLYDNTGLLDMMARFELGELAYCSVDKPGITWHHDVIQRLEYELVAFGGLPSG